MEFVEGRIFTDPSIPEVTPEERRKMYDEFFLSQSRLYVSPHCPYV